MISDKYINGLVKKIEKNIEEIGTELAEYRGCTDGKYFKNKDVIKLNHIFSWQTSFFTGMAYWAYMIGGNEKILKWLYSYYNQYYDKVFKTPLDTMHDLGFIYTPYAVALYKLTGDENMKNIAVKAADELAKRFNPKGGYIQAWGRMDGKIPEYVDSKLAEDVFFKGCLGRTIIDCMMNIPLLFWASEVTGHTHYRKIAEVNADTVLKFIVREDYSVCHAYMFDDETGKPLREEYSCGYSIGSHWARGTAWAVYGYAIAYKYTDKKIYLETSQKLFEKFIEECKGEMPVWDFRLPESESQNIDTSAVAIMLCAALLILKYSYNKKISGFEKTFGEKILEYIDLSLENNGILKEQNGQKVYAQYGDYFLTEYLCMKYNKNFEIIW